MKVLHLRQSGRIYGPEKTILGICRGLQELGHESRIAMIYQRVAGGPKQHPIAVLAHAQGTEYMQLDYRWSATPGVLEALRTRMQEDGIDILHSHDFKSNMVALLATRGMRKRPALVSTPRHSEKGFVLASLQWLDLHCLDRFDRITESSAASVEAFGRYPKLKAKLRLVRHGSDAGTFGAAELLPARGDGPVVSIVARLVAVKGHALFLKAMQQVLGRIPEAQVWVVGEGPLEAQLKQLSSHLGISKNVSFLGYRQDVDQILKMSTATVVASSFETSCRVAMEALELGCPLVATPVGIIPEMLAGGEAGMITPHGDAEAMAANLIRVIEDPELAARMSDRGKERSAGAGRHTEAARMFAAVYEEAIEASRSR
jgi:glycosyltransferase involved in cell wall biosynthesis